MPSETVVENKVRSKLIMEDGFDLRAERSSLQQQHSRSLKEDQFPRGRTYANPEDKIPGQLHGIAGSREYASAKQVGLASSVVKGRNSVKTPSGIQNKPWPSRKATGDDELVKHMSHVPNYLQRRERGENVQEKALNVGVLDWGLLERWVYHQKCVNRKGDYSCSNSASSLFSTHEFSSGSSGSITSERKQACFHMRPHDADKQTQSSGTENSGHVHGHGFKSSSTILDENHHQPVHEACTDPIRNKVNKPYDHERNNSHLKSASDISSVSTPCGNSNLMLENDDTTLQNLGGPRNDKIEIAVKNHDSHKSLHFTDNMPQFTDKRKGMHDHVQESLVSGHASFRSLLFEDSWLIERDINNFSGNLPEDVMFNQQPPDVPYSCPLPRFVPSGPHTTNISSGTLVQPKTSGCSNGVKKQLTGSSLHQDMFNGADNTGQSQVKAINTEGIKSSNHLVPPGPKWACRSSSLKECLSEERRWSFACSNESNGHKGKKSGKDRQNPLKRMIDPLLNPTSSLHVASRTANSLNRHSHESTRTKKPPLCMDLESAYGICKSSNAAIDLICQVKGSLSLPVQESSYCRSSHHDDKSATSSRQAILQLVFRDGLPLYVLSACDNNILAATLSSKSASVRNDLECIYTILTVDESKKKSMMGANLRNKGKKQQLVSNNVGQVKVSTSKSREDEVLGKHCIKEFVLVGVELEAKDQEYVGCTPRGELAAAIVKVPNVLRQSSNAGTSSNGSRWVPLATNSGEKTVLCSRGKQIQTNMENNSITVILPSAVHGSSTDGEPSPLIQRWRSGGACDCGGWDEGCMLTTLTNESQECTSLDLDQDNRIELCTQGGSLRKDCAFSMLSFREGLYTIEFQSSMSLLQAFAICVAILHSRNSGNHSTEIKSLWNQPVIDNVTRPSIRTNQREPTSYVPNHPPLSPVGRA